MPSIERVSPLVLSYRRAEVRAFWMVVVGGTAALLWATGASLGAAAAWLWPLAGAVLLLAPRLVRPSWFEDGIWFWNGAARHGANLLRRYVLMVAYYIVIVPVGRAGGDIVTLRQPPGSSLWAPLPQARGGLSMSDGVVGTVASLRAYARQGGHWWVLSLLPAIWLLTALTDYQRDAAPPTSTYTLF